MKIIIIARNIFPLITPRAFRATSLALQFAKMGHDVFLYAVLGSYDYSNFEKETGILVKNIGKMHFSTYDSSGGFRYNFFDKILYHSLYRVLEFPDIEFLFKVYPILKKEKNCDLLITIANPHPINWGASLAKSILPASSFPKKWISDCGDPYIGDPINRKKFFYFNFIENWWAKKTDFISIPVFEAKKAYPIKFEHKMRVIPQGVDFEGIVIDNYFKKNAIVTFAYSGSVYKNMRDPTKLLNFLKLSEFEFKFIIYTNTPDFYKDIVMGLEDKILLRDYIPREKLIFELSRMDFLINLTNPSTIQEPSKLIDYALTKRPIIDISSEFLEINTFNEFMNGDYKNRKVIDNLNKYDIKNVVNSFINL
jgi:hypothetical protein